MRSIAEIRRFLFREPKTIKAPRKSKLETPFLTFPKAKIDFSDGAYGANGFDLANAFSQKVVRTGDLLEIIQEDLRGRNEVHEVRRVIYLEPEFALLGSRGYHRTWDKDTRAGIDLPNITTQGAIIGWKKIGETPPEELRKIIAAIEATHDEKGSRLVRKPLSREPLL